MKRLFAMCLCLCLCASLSSCAFPGGVPDSSSEYERGWDDGYDLGYYDGYEEGHDEGRSEAELEYEDEYSVGYNDGSNDGYYEGATYTCLFYGDVDRAFKSAYKGSAWGVFIYAYDQYIHNIYDDDETRSELFWALVSVKSGDGLTTEERSLLISTFGKELFEQNDIEI